MYDTLDAHVRSEDYIVRKEESVSTHPQARSSLSAEALAAAPSTPLFGEGDFGTYVDTVDIPRPGVHPTPAAVESHMNDTRQRGNPVWIARYDKGRSYCGFKVLVGDLCLPVTYKDVREWLDSAPLSVLPQSTRNYIPLNTEGRWNGDSYKGVI